MRTLFVQAQLASEVVMVTLIYLERLLTYAEFGFCATNWKRLTLGRDEHFVRFSEDSLFLEY